jgi:hypothetical protein
LTTFSRDYNKRALLMQGAHSDSSLGLADRSECFLLGKVVFILYMVYLMV